MKSLTKLTILLAVLVLLAACAPSAPPPEPTEPPAAEATSVPEPTEESEPTLEEFIVNFYGDSCDSTSPDVLSEGQYAFRLNDVEGTTQPAMYISRLTDGHTFQDLLAKSEISCKSRGVSS